MHAFLTTVRIACHRVSYNHATSISYPGILHLAVFCLRRPLLSPHTTTRSDAWQFTGAHPDSAGNFAHT